MCSQTQLAIGAQKLKLQEKLERQFSENLQAIWQLVLVFSVAQK